MKYSRIPRFHRQRGAVLVVSLIMLAVMTMFVISMLKTAVIELKIGGSSQVAALNLTNADTAIDNFMAVNSGRFAPNFLSSAVPTAAPDPTSFSALLFAVRAGHREAALALLDASADVNDKLSDGVQYTSFSDQLM